MYIFRYHTRSPRIPLELHKEVIDWLDPSKNLEQMRKILQHTLLSCMLVCHDWYPLAYKHLYTSIVIRKGDLLKLRAPFKNNPALPQSLKALDVERTGICSMSAFLISWKLTNLQCLILLGLDLSSESIWLCRAASQLTNVYHLQLYCGKNCTAAQLIRFINSFQSLSYLKIYYWYHIKITGHPLPKCCRLTTGSLTHLNIDIQPGISAVLDWLIKANSTVLYLKQLQLKFLSKEVDTCYQNISALLNHCSDTLVELTLYIGMSEADKLLEYGKLYQLINDSL